MAIGCRIRLARSWKRGSARLRRRAHRSRQRRRADDEGSARRSIHHRASHLFPAWQIRSGCIVGSMAAGSRADARRTSGAPRPRRTFDRESRNGRKTWIQRYSLRGFPPAEKAAMHVAVPAAAAKVRSCSKLRAFNRFLSQKQLGTSGDDYEPELGLCRWSVPSAWYPSWNRRHRVQQE